MLSRFLHSFRWALQPVKHISSRRFARLSSHLLCNATVPVQFHLAVPLSRLTGNWQVTTICNNLWNFCTRARQFPNRREAKKKQELKDSQSESVLGSDLVFSVLCWLWQLVLWHFDYATDAFTSYSYKFFNKSDKSKTPPTLSQATHGVTRVEFIRNPCPKLQHLSHNTQTGSASAEQPSKKSKHP